MNNIEIGRLYCHSKTGKLYKVITVAKDSETLEDVVVYEAMYNNNVSQMWARPLTEFLGKVIINSETVQRFKKV